MDTFIIHYSLVPFPLPTFLPSFLSLCFFPNSLLFLTSCCRSVPFLLSFLCVFVNILTIFFYLFPPLLPSTVSSFLSCFLLSFMSAFPSSSSIFPYSFFSIIYFIIHPSSPFFDSCSLSLICNIFLHLFILFVCLSGAEINVQHV